MRTSDHMRRAGELVEQARESHRARDLPSTRSSLRHARELLDQADAQIGIRQQREREVRCEVSGAGR